MFFVNLPSRAADEDAVRLPLWLLLAATHAALPPGLPGQDELHVARLFDACARGGQPAADAQRQLLANPTFALPVLTSRLQESFAPDRRALAARLLGMLGEHGLPALDALLEAVWDPDPDVAGKALAALAEVGPWAERELRRHAKKEVFAALRGPTAREGLEPKAILRAYYRMDIDPRMSVEILGESLGSAENPLILEYLCTLAGRRGAEATPLLPRLVQLLGIYKVEMVWVVDRTQMQGRREPVAIPGVRRDLNTAAADAILAIDPNSEAAAHVYVRRIRDSLTDLDAQRQAMIELGRLGANARPAVHTLVDLLENGSGRIRWEAATTLGAIGPAASRAVPALERASREVDPQLRERARVALQHIRGG